VGVSIAEAEPSVALGAAVVGSAEYGVAREDPAGVGDTPLGDDGPHALSARAATGAKRARETRGRVLIARR
jgi:hypothetical protein